ncbi:MAG: flagellar basal body-associated FliL family protein [bacterium]
MAMDEETSLEPKRKGKSLKKFLIITGAVVLILVLQLVGSHLLVKAMFFTPKKAVEPESEGEEQSSGVYLLDDLIINPAASGGRRHLLVSLGLECEGKLVLEEIVKRDAQIRDNLITLLAGLEIDILADIQYRERIRSSLLKAINFHLSKGEVQKLYFAKYVFQ